MPFFGRVSSQLFLVANTNFFGRVSSQLFLGADGVGNMTIVQNSHEIDRSTIHANGFDRASFD